MEQRTLKARSGPSKGQSWGSSLKRAERPQSTAKGKGQGQAEADYQRSAKPSDRDKRAEQSKYKEVQGREL